MTTVINATTKKAASLQVNDSGQLLVTGTGGGGGSGDASAANQVLQTTQLTAINTNTSNTATNTGTTNTRLGDVTEAAPASDTASSGINGRLQRVAQRLSSLITAMFSSTAMSDAARVPMDMRDGLAVSGSVSAAAVLFTQDMLGYNSLSLQVTSPGTTCTITYEGSEDNATWSPVTALDGGSTSGNTSTISTTTGILLFPRYTRYFRARVSTYTSGTVTVVGQLRQTPFSYQAKSTVAVAGGTVAEDAAAGTSPLLVGGVVRTATAPTTLVAGDVSRLTMSSAAQAIIKPYSVGETDWQFTASATTTTSALAAKAAGAASIRNYVVGIIAQNTSATATTLLIQDGATVIFQCLLTANMTAPIAIQFPTPLRGTAATAMNYNFGTAGATVLLNMQGYQSV